MARAGRRRKQGARQPNGQLRRERPEEIMSVAIAQRLKVVPKDDARDQKAGTPLGILFLNKKITRAQWEAGDKFTRVVSAWRWAVSAPKPFPSSMGAKTGKVRFFAEEADEAKAKNQARRNYEDARAALMDAGTAAYVTVMALCGNEQEIKDIDPAVRGLRTLVRHFEIEEE